MPPKGRGAASSSTGRIHPWDLYPATAAGYAQAGEEFGGWEEDVEAGDISPADAGDKFASPLLKLRLQGHLSARQICILAHWSSLAGARGPCADFAAKPGLQSGSYQRKLDTYMRVDDDMPFFDLHVPGFDRTEAVRTVHKLETVPPHESLAKEVLAEPAILERVRKRGARPGVVERVLEAPGGHVCTARGGRAPAGPLR